MFVKLKDDICYLNCKLIEPVGVLLVLVNTR